MEVTIAEETCILLAGNHQIFLTISTRSYMGIFKNYLFICRDDIIIAFSYGNSITTGESSHFMCIFTFYSPSTVTQYICQSHQHLLKILLVRHLGRRICSLRHFTPQFVLYRGEQPPECNGGKKSETKLNFLYECPSVA